MNSNKNIIATIASYLNNVTQIVYNVSYKSIERKSIQYSDIYQVAFTNRYFYDMLGEDYPHKFEIFVYFTLYIHSIPSKNGIYHQQVYRYRVTLDHLHYIKRMNFINYLIHIPIMREITISSNYCTKCHHYRKLIMMVLLTRGYESTIKKRVTYNNKKYVINFVYIEAIECILNEYRRMENIQRYVDQSLGRNLVKN